MQLRLVNLLGLAELVLAVASSGMQRPTEPILPDPKRTPGDTLPVTARDICVPGYSRKVRNVPAAVKRQAYASYGIATHSPGQYEVDHLVSLELGGSNSLKNLWPESFRTQPWNARVKDALENELHDEVCSGKLDLAVAQKDIAKDWIAAYKKYFHTDQPLTQAARRGKRSAAPVSPVNPPEGKVAASSSGSPAPTPSPAPLPDGNAPGAASGQVWVNLSSGKYFRQGSRYYGKTKRGKYMSEGDAINEGYKPAGGQ